MKKLLILLTILLIGSLSFGQTFQWANRIGGNSAEAGNDIKMDKFGNSYSVGKCSGTVDFDPGSSIFNLTGGSNDTYILKLDSLGNFIWAKRLDIFAGYGLAKLSIDDLGNIYMAGFFYSTTDFDPGPGVFNLTPSGMFDAYILKLSSQGDFVWAKRLGGAGNDEARSVCLTKQGEVVVGGTFSGTGDFNPNAGVSNLSSAGNTDAFVVKLDTAGNFVWAKSFGGTAIEFLFSLAADHAGNIYSAGSFEGTTDLDPGPAIASYNSYGSQEDIFISKLDASGNFLWGKRCGNTSIDEALAIIVDSVGNSYTTGYFSLSVDFDPGPGGYTLSGGFSDDVFVLKLNFNGDFVWARNFGGSGSVRARAIDIDSIGNVFTTGNYTGSIDFDPGPATKTFNSAGINDVFVSKLDTAGNYDWTKRIGGIDNDFAYSIATDNAGHVYTIGSFLATVDFNPSISIFTLTEAGGGDIFIQKLGPCIPTDSTFVTTACDSLTINGQIYSSTGVYTQILTNAEGCDSLLTINLTIKNSTGSSFSQTACDSIISNGQTYFTTGTYLQTYTNAQGCDSVLTLNLIINHPSSNTITQTACDSITINSQTYTSSGSYTQMFTNSQGCDSTLNINLTINVPTTNSISQSGCDSITINNQTYYNSGTYTQTLTNSQNCDSILTLNLTINNSSTNTITQTACNSYSLNSQTYTASGTYNQSLTNVQGCDSFLTLNLTINSTTATATASGLVLNASPSGATYQWLNCNPYSMIAGETNQTFTVTANGDYAVSVTQNGCNDTSNCFSFTNVGVNEIELSGISVYPNPTSNKFIISSENILQQANLQLLNALGQVVYKQENISTKELEIDITNFAKGLYTLELEEGLKVSRLKILKK